MFVHIWLYDKNNQYLSAFETVETLKALMRASFALPQAWVYNSNPDPVSPLVLVAIHFGPGLLWLKASLSIVSWLLLTTVTYSSFNTFTKLCPEVGRRPKCVFQPENQWWVIRRRRVFFRRHTPTHAVRLPMAAWLILVVRLYLQCGRQHRNSSLSNRTLVNGRSVQNKWWY